MEYVIRREDVYAGSIFIQDEAVYNSLFGKDDKLGVYLANFTAKPCRCLLLDKDNKDLVFDCPVNYDLEGDNEGIFFIANKINLNTILKVLKFKEELTQKDIDKIYKKLIVNNWWFKMNKKKLKKILTSDEFMDIEVISAIKKGRPDSREPEFMKIKKR